MEIFLTIAILIILFCVLGETVVPALIALLWVLEIFILLCVLFFVVMITLTILAKTKKAKFLRVDGAEKGIKQAIYEIEGKEYKNAFPTDAFMKNLLYRKTDVKVRFLKLGKTGTVFDWVSQSIMAIGLPAFSFLAYIVFQVIFFMF